MHVPLEDRVRRWLDQAATDLAISIEVRERYAHQACFHAQQSAEKALKALLTRLSGGAIPTQQLERLMLTFVKLDIRVPDDVRADARSLDKFYVSTRYPDALGFADAALAYQPRDADAAIVSAERVRAWCDRELSIARANEPNPP